MDEFFFTSIYLLLIVGAGASDMGCDSHATILRHFEREGFHIDVHYRIELVVNVETAPKWGNCTILIRENITDSFYINPNQLSELNRAGIAEACTTHRVDIESPQHLSQPHTLYIYGKPSRYHNLIYSNLNFPMHLRYHKPKANGGYSLAEFKLPLLLIHCPDIECKNLLKSKTSCSNCGKDVCTWIRLPFKTNNQNMTMPVPVGNLNDLLFVKPVTYVLTFGACLYILLTITARVDNN